MVEESKSRSRGTTALKIVVLGEGKFLLESVNTQKDSDESKSRHTSLLASQ